MYLELKLRYIWGFAWHYYSAAGKDILCLCINCWSHATFNKI